MMSRRPYLCISNMQLFQLIEKTEMQRVFQRKEKEKEKERDDWRSESSQFP